MLLVSNLYDSVRIQAGQYLIPTHKLELKENLFLPLVSQALAIYNRYCPFDFHLNLEINDRQFIFNENSTPYGIPDKIVDLIPYGGSINIFSNLFYNSNSQNSELSVKQMCPFIYRKPNLYPPYAGVFDAHCIVYHKISKVNVEGGEISAILTLDENDSSEFVQLCLAKFLQALGRSRRAFTLNDLPITNDSSELVGEGQALEERIIQDIIDNKQKFYLCWS